MQKLLEDVENNNTVNKSIKSNKTQNLSIAKSTSSVSAMTMVSRVLGFIRDMVCANIFGASSSYDAFLVAFKIPNFLRRLFAEGAFAQAFVPILSEYRATRSPEAVQKLINHVTSLLGSILLIVSILGMLGAPIVIRIFAPGFVWSDVASSADFERLYLAENLLRITFPYIFFISLTALLGSILNSFDKFTMPAFAPVLLNIAMIFSSLCLAKYFANPITALAWGVCLGGILQLLFLVFFIWKIKLFPKLINPKLKSPNGDRTGVTRILKNMLPAMFGVSVAQINLLFDTAFASFLPLGSISWLYYSDRLMEFPLGVFGVALATVVLPHLSREYSKNNHQNFIYTLDWALQLIVLIALPASIGLFLLAEPLLVTLFYYGKFTAIDVYKSGLSLKAFACGLFAFINIKILASSFYAQKNIKTPVIVAACCMVINIVLSLILMQFFYHVGLAMAGAITGFLNAGLLLYLLIKHDIYKPVLEWRYFIIKIILANLLWGILVYYFTPNIELWFTWNAVTRASILFGIIISVLIVYFGFLKLIGFNFKKHLIV